MRWPTRLWGLKFGSGGHVYCYVAEPLPTVRERLHEELDAWAEFVHNRIDEFGGPSAEFDSLA